MAAGVRCFEAGVEGDIEAGRDESRAAVRRKARQPRRQTWRRMRRRRKLLRALQRFGLMPAGPTETAEEVQTLLAALDRELRAKHLADADRRRAHLLPYLLRAKALDEHLEPFELGRALYHLAQRRGFDTNRRGGKSDDDGPVREGIGELERRMRDSGARTLGEFFAGLDPEDERIRTRWTSRDMYRREFDQIWTKQAEYHSGLTSKARREVESAIFFQRPLKSVRHLIGRCEVFPDQRRAPMALLVAQRFRMLQMVNNLEAIEPGAAPRRLRDDERATLLNALERAEKVTFAKARSLLKLPKGTKFNYEEGGEKGLIGNKTSARMREAFGERWDELTDAERHSAVEDVRSFEKRDALMRRGRVHWGLDADGAERLADVRLEDGYSGHCERALRMLVEQMEDGTPYMTAKRALFGDRMESSPPLDQLPPVLEAAPSLRNPAVIRAMTELRKVVNALVRRYGKPESVRIELARELKKSRKRREQEAKRMNDRRRERERVLKAMLEKLPGLQPRGSDIEKWLLAEECGWICPYTGRCIDARSLLGPNPEFDVEHILPRRFLDNSFLNKTLCYHEENRNRKRDRLPAQAYSGERYEEILERVRRFKGDAAREKLRRFEMEEVPDDFVSAQLNDTRQASVAAAAYLGLLYGGAWDAEGTRRVYAVTGGLTHHLRNEWQLNGILDDGGEKTRDDHRHHAVDAVVIGLTEPRTVAALAKAAERASETGRRMFAPVEAPWPDFVDSVREAVEGIVVSHRVDRKVRGPLHAETLYSKPKGRDGEDRHVRKALHKLTVKEIMGDAIVDPAIRALVQAKFEELGGGKPDKAFADPKNHPSLTTKDGRRIPIHKARVRARPKAQAVGRGARERFVTSGAGTNHHLVVVAVLDGKAREKAWEYHLVDRLTVMALVAENRKRRREGKPLESVVRRDWGEGRRPVMWLSAGDSLVMKDEDGQERVYRVCNLSGKEMELKLHNDARPSTELRKKKGARIRATPAVLRKREARKVIVSPLGEVFAADAGARAGSDGGAGSSARAQ